MQQSIMSASLKVAIAKQSEFMCHSNWIGPPPSLLVIVLDTNPYAWASLAGTLPLSKAVANLFIFINAHLAFNHSNRVAVIASHCDRTAWLYPTLMTPPSLHNGYTPSKNSEARYDTHSSTITPSDANKYRPFRQIEDQILFNLRNLLSNTTPTALRTAGNTTLLAGSLTLALSYINKITLSLYPSPNPTSTPHQPPPDPTSTNQTPLLNSRILIISASGDLATQYIPIMNIIFAASHSRIPIDILKLAGDTVLLQQASYTTHGIFLAPSHTTASTTTTTTNDATQTKSKTADTPNAQGILQYLLQAFLPDAAARQHLVPPTAPNVDFRAACFCHRRVVDIGYVCSICLSIFCAPLVAENGGLGTCLTCGTSLRLGEYGTGEMVVAKKRKKRPKSDGIGTEGLT